MTMTVLASANSQLDSILDALVNELQLTPARHSEARERYEGVSEWLCAAGSNVCGLRPSIYPQGSLRIDTTVKPLRGQEFDLDLVCELGAGQHLTPTSAYDALWDRMYSNGNYRSLLVKERRCIRLSYANDFHLDIVPAVPRPEHATSTSIVIPDREKKAWHPSNPKGYAKWFEERAVLPYRKHALDASIEPLGVPQSAKTKSPLKLAVQVLKRWRDVAFEGREQLQPSSIVLTTLAAHLYKKEQHVTETISGILRGIGEWVAREPIHLWNPANPQESITERWHETAGAYQAFLTEIAGLAARWNAIVSRGVYPAYTDELGALLGSEAVKLAVRRYGGRIKDARDAGSLYATRSGALVMGSTASAVQVPRHTFHGDGRK